MSRVGLEAHACSLRIFVMLHVSDAVAEQLKLLGVSRPDLHIRWSGQMLQDYCGHIKIPIRSLLGQLDHVNLILSEDIPALLEKVLMIKSHVTNCSAKNFADHIVVWG